MKCMVRKMKNTLHETDSRLDTAGEKISELAAIATRIIQNKTQRKKEKREEDQWTKGHFQAA